MKNHSIVNKMFISFGIIFILSFVLTHHNIDIRGYNFDNNTHNSNKDKFFVLINSSNINGCKNQIPKISYIFASVKNHPYIIKSNMQKNDINENNRIYQTDDSCIIIKISNNGTCNLSPFDLSTPKCKISNSDGNLLNRSNFDKDGLLIIDTKFNNQFSYELADSLNLQKKIRVNIDLAKHTQSNNNNINSPRVELLRENLDGELNMSDAKNQEILWEGNIKSFFKNPSGKYQDEIYIDLIFNTGHHTGNKPIIEKRALGVLFDVSGSSNPYLFEYRDNGKYTRFDADLLKQLANNDFIFYSTGKNGTYHYINNLTNSDNIKLKVKTYLTNAQKRVVEAYIDGEKGKEIPYWILKDVSKLKDNDKIGNKTGFLETIYQGSGFTSVRTDNIETHLKSFNSFILK